MSEQPDAATKVIVWALIGPPVLAFILSLSVFGTIYETWVAMTIWGWFAPWPLPFTFWQGVGMNAAVSLIFRQMTAVKDDREGFDAIKQIFLFYAVSPTIGLGLMWVLSRFV